MDETHRKINVAGDLYWVPPVMWDHPSTEIVGILLHRDVGTTAAGSDIGTGSTGINGNGVT